MSKLLRKYGKPNRIKVYRDLNHQRVSESLRQLRGSLCELLESLCELQESLCELRESLCELRESLCELRESLCELRELPMQELESLCENWNHYARTGITAGFERNTKEKNKEIAIREHRLIYCLYRPIK